jgi:hypothetical protein
LRIRLQMIRTFACGGAETTFSHHLILNTIIRQAREFHRNALFFAGRSPRARRLRVSRRGRQRRGLRGRRIRCGRRRLTGSSALHLQLLASSDCRRLTRSLEYNFGLSNSSFNPKLGHCSSSRLDMMMRVGGRSAAEQSTVGDCVASGLPSVTFCGHFPQRLVTTVGCIERTSTYSSALYSTRTCPREYKIY